MGLLRRLRSVRMRYVTGAIALASLLIVLFSIPGRWDGRRTDQDAFVPLRPITSQEAAALLNDAATGDREHTVVTRLTATEAVLETQVYLFRLESAPTSCQGIVIDQACHGLSETSWEGYVNRYRLDRAPLEAALGRRLEERDLHAEVFEGWAVSFDPARLWVYALTEVLLLTAFGSAHFLILVRARRPMGVLPAVLALWLGFCLAVFAYAPALFDADWFFQRIVVERMALTLALLGAVCLPVASFSALFYVVFRAIDGWGGGDWTPRWRLRAGVVGLVIGLVALHFAWDYSRYRGGAARCAALLDRARAHASPERIDALLTADEMRSAPIHENFLDGSDLSEPLRGVILEMLSPARAAPGYSLELYVELEPSRYLFLWSTPSHDYADVRPLTHQIHQEQIDKVRSTGGRVDAGFRSYMLSWHSCAVRLDRPRAPVIVVAGEDLLARSRWTLTRILYQSWASLVR